MSVLAIVLYLVVGMICARIMYLTDKVFGKDAFMLGLVTLFWPVYVVAMAVTMLGKFAQLHTHEWTSTGRNGRQYCMKCDAARVPPRE